jgi:hypothetical protein
MSTYTINSNLIEILKNLNCLPLQIPVFKFFIVFLLVLMFSSMFIYYIGPTKSRVPFSNKILYYFISYNQFIISHYFFFKIL